MSTILKLFVFPISLIIILIGLNTILGGHITPGGGFQGGAMIAGGIIFCIIVYGLEESPIKISHSFMASLESAGALGYIFLGLAGLVFSGFFMYNLGVDLYNIVPQFIQNLFDYPDPVHAGIIPYLNFVVGLKVLVGLSAVVIAFLESDKLLRSDEQRDNLFGEDEQ
ncbi:MULTISPECIES: MnhB domain-containing protein [Methanobacterium]|jgi:energy-converting hydrogenase B subunit I|uniref:Cation:proton antiporter n=1 Tax=Methanobacterium bryantii TaxID=2161 RepID=A0A2A2H6T2_METBR|nr:MULTISPECIES: MnhB domain-containing protein [Methanobacterium]OEC85020.1 cation:proton antiporter [Methanobacterium sp. A39]PAV05171.1 cation:proton antiporter [Methanobacterium bryantii]